MVTLLISLSFLIGGGIFIGVRNLSNKKEEAEKLELKIDPIKLQ